MKARRAGCGAPRAGGAIEVAAAEARGARDERARSVFIARAAARRLIVMPQRRAARRQAVLAQWRRAAAHAMRAKTSAARARAAAAKSARVLLTAV